LNRIAWLIDSFDRGIDLFGQVVVSVLAEIFLQGLGNESASIQAVLASVLVGSSRQIIW
jgi:hypothetical protein